MTTEVDQAGKTTETAGRAAMVAPTHPLGIADLIAHYQAGDGERHWFDRGTMAFFGSRIQRGLFSDYEAACSYFVTSEAPPFRDAANGERAFTVRCYDWATREISTIGAFRGYATRGAALAAAKDAAYKAGVR